MLTQKILAFRKDLFIYNHTEKVKHLFTFVVRSHFVRICSFKFLIRTDDWRRVQRLGKGRSEHYFRSSRTASQKSGRCYDEIGGRIHAVVRHYFGL